MLKVGDVELDISNGQVRAKQGERLILGETVQQIILLGILEELRNRNSVVTKSKPRRKQ